MTTAYRPIDGHADPLSILLDGEAVLTQFRPDLRQWRHFGFGKDEFDRYFARFLEEPGRAASGHEEWAWTP